MSWPATAERGSAAWRLIDEPNVRSRGESASIEAAKWAGGIQEVASVDHRTTNLLGIVGDFCTIVTGN